MTISEILEAHQLSGAAYRGGYAYTNCDCGEQYKTRGWFKAYEHWRNSHLAPLIEQHMQERDLVTAGKMRRVMNGQYSSFDDTYSIHRRGLENIVLELEGREPFTDKEDEDES